MSLVYLCSGVCQELRRDDKNEVVLITVLGFLLGYKVCIHYRKTGVVRVDGFIKRIPNFRLCGVFVFLGHRFGMDGYSVFFGYRFGQKGGTAKAHRVELDDGRGQPIAVLVCEFCL